MANIDKGFNVEIISLGDRTLITSGEIDPRISGYEAPEGSLFVYKNGINSAVLVKKGPLHTDWKNDNPVPLGGSPGEYLVKNTSADYDLVYTDRAHASVLKAYAKNTGLTTLPKGTPVFASGGVSGTAINVQAADASSVTTMPAIGVLGEALAPESEGELLVLGEIMGVDTSTFEEGDLVYVAAGGGYTNILPTDTNVQVQFLGIVTKKHKTNGGGLITGTGVPDHYRVNTLTGRYEVWDGAVWQPVATTSLLNDLSDVVLTTPTPGEVLTYNGTDWVNAPGGGAASSHNTLSDRELSNQHPIASITGLESVLESKADIDHTHPITDLTVDGVTDGLLLQSGATEWQAVSPAAVVLPTVGRITNDISGFPNRTDTSLTFNAATRTVTLTPLNINAKLYHLGIEYPLTVPLSVQWSNTNSGRYIIFDPATQSLVEYGPTPDIRSGQVLVAYVYWNANTQRLVLAGDERHGSYRDTQWHFTQHRDVGGVWRSGGALTYTLDDDAAVSVAVSTPLVFADEDLEHQITHSDAPSGPYQQPLSGTAMLPVVWLNGTVMDEVSAQTGTHYLYGGNRALYNPDAGGVGSLVEVPSGKYINYWLIATNDTEYTVKLVVGRQLFDSVEATADEVLQQYGLPFAEMAIMYRIVLHIDDAHTLNPAKAVIKTVVNAYRSIIGGVTAISASSHDALSGRELSNQHPINAITNLQTSLDNKSDVTHTHTLGWLSDVTLSSPQVGDSVYYNGSTWINYGPQGGPQGGGAAKRIWSNNILAQTGTTVITPGTTPPLSTEGTQLWQLTITPLSNTTTYVIQTSVAASGGVNNSVLTLALFRNDVFIGGTTQTVNSSNNSATLTISITDRPATTQPIVYQLRIGINTNTWYINRRIPEVTYGGLNNGWVVWEY